LSRLIEKPDLKKGFGAELRRRRIQSGISQERLAELADLHRTYISAVESGRRNLTLESIQRLARALGVTVASLFSSVENLRNLGGKRSGNGAGDHNGRILLVEDDLKDVQFTLAAFKEAKVANPVDVVVDGAAAVGLLDAPSPKELSKTTCLPQVVLLDLQLPKINGLGVLRRFKAHRLWRNVPVVVLTASQNDRDLQEAMRLGASACLTKPVDFHRFAQITPKLKLRWALL
jgi:CheY-like chemotaxis protein/DNA-binding XRE family transcriptional regulator